MRIQIVTNEYAGVTSYSGGIGTQYANLAPALAAQDAAVHVITLADANPVTIQRDGVTIVRVQVPRRPELIPAAWPLAVERALRGLPKPDAVVAAEYSAGAAFYASRRRRAPVVTHLHGSLAQVVAASRWSLPRRLLPQTVTQRVLERLQARRSDALISPSAHLLECSRKLWPIGGIPAEVVPNTVDVQRVRRLARGEAPPELRGEGPLVVFTGRLEQRKGVHVLVEAMRAVWQARPGARLALVGGHDGEWQGRPMSEHVRGLAGENRDRLLLLGHLPAERLFPCLAAADVVALPSLWESFSLAALEAMAVGRPLVATSGVFPPFVGADREALLVPPGDAGALAAALLRVLDEPDLARALGDAGSVTADEHDVGPSAQRFLDAVSSLTGASP